MSKNQLALSEERKKEVIEEFVNMYVDKGGEFPTSRDIKKNKYISVQEVATISKLGLLEDWRVRELAKAKTGINYPPISKRRQERKVKSTPNESRKEEVGMNESAKVSEVAKAPAAVGPARKTAYIEDLKQVLRDFAVEELRWPTDTEVRALKQNGAPGWQDPNQIRRHLGDKSKWAEQIFPEGTPDGFTATNARGGRHKKSIDREKPIAKKDIDVLKKRMDWIYELISEGRLDTALEMSSQFSIKSEITVQYKGKELSLAFEVK